MCMAAKLALWQRGPEECEGAAPKECWLVVVDHGVTHLGGVAHHMIAAWLWSKSLHGISYCRSSRLWVFHIPPCSFSYWANHFGSTSMKTTNVSYLSYLNTAHIYKFAVINYRKETDAAAVREKWKLMETSSVKQPSFKQLKYSVDLSTWLCWSK